MAVTVFLGRNLIHLSSGSYIEPGSPAPPSRSPPFVVLFVVFF
jgi:hypothetical protein